MGYNSMRHCFFGIEINNSDHLVEVMAAAACSFDFGNGEEYFEAIEMDEKDEGKSLDVIRTILIYHDRKNLFTDQKVQVQVEHIYRIVSEYYSASLLFFKGSLSDYFTGSKMAEWLDIEWGEGTAEYLQNVVDYFCRNRSCENMDRVWISAFDRMGDWKKEGFSPDSKKVQQEATKIYEGIKQSKWLIEDGKREALRKMAEMLAEKEFRKIID